MKFVRPKYARRGKLPGSDDLSGYDTGNQTVRIGEDYAHLRGVTDKEKYEDLLATIRHEIGHFLDDQIGEDLGKNTFASYLGRLKGVIQDDIDRTRGDEALFQRLKDGFGLDGEFWEYILDTRVTDFFCAMTGGRLHSFAVKGHGEKYFAERPHRAHVEIFADFFSLYSTKGNDDKIDFLRKLYPDTIAELGKFIKLHGGV